MSAPPVSAVLRALGCAIAAAVFLPAAMSAAAGEPAHEGRGPSSAAGEPWPVVVGILPATGERSPAAGRHSVGDGSRPAIGGTRPAAGKPPPAAGESLPAAGESPPREPASPHGLAAPQGGGEPPSASDASLRPASEAELREALGRLAEARLAPLGLHLDLSRARLTLSRPLASGTALEARPAWPDGARPPTLPLPFELHPLDGAPALRASLAVPLHADVWTAARRVERGERLSCADLRPARRALQAWPADALGVPCRLPAGAVVLRRLAAHDVLRHADLGTLPAVLAERELGWWSRAAASRCARAPSRCPMRASARRCRCACRAGRRCSRRA